MSGKLILYGDLLSQPVRAVYFFCTLNNIPFDFKAVVIGRGETLSDDYGKINPFHKVPTLQDGQEYIYESHNILRYLSQKYNLNQFYNTNDVLERCKVDTYLDWHHLGLRRYASTLFFQKFVIVRMGKKQLPQFIRDAEINLPLSLETIENQFLKKGNQDYLCGSKPTLADLSCFCELKQLLAISYSFENYPILTAWMKRIESLKGYQESHKTLLTLLIKLSIPQSNL